MYRSILCQKLSILNTAVELASVLSVEHVFVVIFTFT